MRIDGNYDRYQSKQTKSAQKTTDKQETKEAVKSEKAEKAPEKRTDTFTRSDKTAVSVDYKSKSALGIKNEGMKDLVAQMLGNQATKGGKGFTAGVENLLRSYGLEPIKSDGSDDFWGAEKTAKRILDFAKSLAGNDKEAFNTVKNAFEKGFKECEKIWGGSLPGVCYDTLDRVHKGFDEWEKELNAAQ